MAWSTSLKGLVARRLGRTWEGADHPAVTLSQSAIRSWQRRVARGPTEVGTWVGGTSPALWGGPPAPELIGLDVGADRALAEGAAPELTAFHTSIADAARRARPDPREQEGR